MAVEKTTYTGRAESIRKAGTTDTAYQRLTTNDQFSSIVKYAVFTKVTFLRAIGLEAFGVEAVQDIGKFGVAKSSGRMLQYGQGYSFRGFIQGTTGNSFHVGRLSNHTPELVEGGDEYAYAWHRLVNTQFIPDVDVQDNESSTLIDIKAMKMELMLQQFVQDLNYSILGNSSAPDASTLAPAAVKTDLANLLEVTSPPTQSVGAIAGSNAYWQPEIKAITTIGGGGEMDRPIILRRSMMDGKNDAMKKAEATNDYLFLCSQGAWQYYDRLMYADSIQGRNGGVMGSKAKYDAVGIQNFAFDGNPMIWDPSVVVPTGATASTETIYGIHIPSFCLSIHKGENFRASGWENPREHDIQKTLVASCRTRYTPALKARRPHVIFHNMPANPD